MNELKKYNNELDSIDWAEIKKVLNTIINLLQGVCDILPPGTLMQQIVCGLISVLKIVLSMIPSS